MKAKRVPIAMVPLDHVQQRILILRGQRVILASDLARLYGVPVRRLNEQVKRNASRFPEDFVFQLSKAEAVELSRSQIATLNDPQNLKSQSATSRRGSNIKYLPYAFTEHGVAMAANLLRTPQAVSVSVFVVRAFVQLRQLLSTHHDLAAKLRELELKLQNHDDKILSIIDAIHQLMEEPEDPPKPPIGYQTEIQGVRSSRQAVRRGTLTAKS